MIVLRLYCGRNDAEMQMFCRHMQMDQDVGQEISRYTGMSIDRKEDEKGSGTAFSEPFLSVC